MFFRGFFVFLFLASTGLAPLQATTISIENEPPELVSLRQSYEAGKKTAIEPIEARYQQDIATVEKLSVGRPELKKTITSEYEKQKKAALGNINAKYIKDLEALEQTLIQKRNLKGALVVQEEKERIMNGASVSAISAPQRVETLKTTPPPAASKPKAGPFVYKSDTEGRAGAPGFSKNNIYKFSMNEVRGKTKLTIYASGRGSTNTYGDIYLITPTGQKQKIFDWSPSDFKNSVKDVRSYKKLKPIATMVSEYVTRPGTYKIEFNWQKGVDPLIIKYIELITW